MAALTGGLYLLYCVAVLSPCPNEAEKPATNPAERTPMTRALLLSLSLLACPPAFAYTPQAGDIVFHTSLSSQSIAVQAATRSPYSHMGIVLMKHGKPYVFEAVQPVKYTPLQAWLDRGKNKRYVVKRLAPPRPPMTLPDCTRMPGIMKASPMI